MKKMKREGLIEDIPLNGFVSAVSVGIVENEKLLDLCYAEDSKAMVDMNVVMTDRGEYRDTRYGRRQTVLQRRAK